MKTKFLILLFLFIQVNSILFGQVTFQKNFGISTTSSYSNTIKQTADSGYVCIGGAMRTPGTLNMDVSIIKINSSGDTLWTKLIGTDATEYGYYMQITNDNGFVIDGWSRQTGGNYEIYLIKLNSTGDTNWTRLFLIPSTNTSPCGIVQTNEGDYVLIGTQDLGGCNYNSYLLKVDQNGNLIWARNYNYVYGTSFIKTKDNGFLFVAYPGSFSINPNAGLFIVKTDFNGDTMWVKNYNGLNIYNIRAESVQQTIDTGYIITGYIQDSLNNSKLGIFLLKLNPSGQISWVKRYDFADFEEGTSVKQTSDGGFIFSGYFEDPGTSVRHAILVKTNNVGDIEWSNKYGTLGSEYFHDVQTTFDHGYIACGETSTDGYIVKVDSVGNSGCYQEIIHPQISTPTFFLLSDITLGSIAVVQDNCLSFVSRSNFYIDTFCSSTSIAEYTNISDVVIYPNPFSYSTTLDFMNKENKAHFLKIYNSKGQLVKQINNITSGQIKLERLGLDNGIYFFQLQNNNEIINSGKFIIE